MKLTRKIFIQILILISVSNVSLAQNCADTQESSWNIAKSVKSYNDYIACFPDGKYVNKARRAQEKIDYKQSKNLKMPMFYKSKYPNGKYHDTMVKLQPYRAQLTKGNFSKIEFSKKGVRFFYENTSVNKLAMELKQLFTDYGYKIDEGSIYEGIYGRDVRLAGGSVETYTTFNFSVKKYNEFVVLELGKGTSFFSGGIVGLVDNNNRFRKFFHMLYESNL